VAVVRIDINGQLVALPQRLAEQLRDAAASSASTSLTRRDLSLVLDRAIRTSKLVALQRAEARSLAELLDEQHWGAKVAELRDALQRD
jgi:hypothetical protein